LNKQMIFWGVLMVLIIIVSGCTSASKLKCEPDVVVTDIDYTSDPLSVPYTDVHQVFAENYTGSDLSSELRAEIIEIMREKAIGVDQDPDRLYECITATYPDWNTRPNRIPCYAEKCVYTNESIWAIAFNRANSFDGSLAHFDLFFVSDSTYEIVYHTGCY
jgi:hypothetical protein